MKLATNTYHIQNKQQHNKEQKKHTQQKNIMANTTDYERLLEEQKQFYEKKQKENLDTIVMLTEQVKKLKEKNEKLKKSENYLYEKLTEEKEAHSQTLNDMLETFNLPKGTERNAQSHAEHFTNAKSKEGHYRTLIGQWYLMCFKEQNKKLKESVKYWKNFALHYWSGAQLGEDDVGCQVWKEALEEVNTNEDADREALTKKCMEA